MRMPGMMMVMMRGHELLYYNICGSCKAAMPAFIRACIKSLIFSRFPDLP